MSGKLGLSKARRQTNPELPSPPERPYIAPAAGGLHSTIRRFLGPCTPGVSQHVGSGTSLHYSSVTDIGLRRQKNQDSQAVVAPWSREQYRRTGWLFVVADGMGAHAAGERASDLAVKTVPPAYQRLATRSPPLALLSSIRQANELIHQQGEATPEFRGMGTTCTALALLPRGAVVGHVGDSRAYRIRSGTIEQFSRDHSLAWEMEALHPRSGGEQVPSPPKNIITRSLGPHAQVEVDLEGPFPIAEGDTFVVCSDGLSGQVADDEIGMLAGILPPEEAVSALLGLTLVRGAPDNVTLIIARAGHREATSPTAETEDAWPLTAGDAAPIAAKPLPVRWLGLAGASLLGTLISASQIGPETWDRLREGLLPAGLPESLTLLLLAGLALLFVATIILAIAGFLPAGGSADLLLPAGKRLGGGPYRSFACGPSADLLEGIVSSVESAADGLGDTERHACLEHVAAARTALAGGDFTVALAAATEGIALYKRAVELARGDDTIATPGD
jgi:serine/threonine protein phosphatase PrpC